MYTIYVTDVPKLKQAISTLLPLLNIDLMADIKCSPDFLSLIVYNHSFPFVASVQLSKYFFRFFGSDTEIVFRRRTCLSTFFQTLCSVPDHGFTLTIQLQESQELASLKFQNSISEDVRWFTLPLSPPLAGDIPDPDYRVSLAINPEEFRRVVARLNVYNEIIRVTLTEFQVKFSVAAEEIILTKERSQCDIGGVYGDAVSEFPITLNPVDFFLQTSRRSSKVWLLNTPDSGSVMIFPTDSHAHIQVNFRLGSPSGSASSSSLVRS